MCCVKLNRHGRSSYACVAFISGFRQRTSASSLVGGFPGLAPRSANLCNSASSPVCTDPDSPYPFCLCPNVPVSGQRRAIAQPPRTRFRLAAASAPMPMTITSPPEPSRTGASAELRLLIFANTWLRPPRLRARLPRSEMLPETRLVRVGVAPRLFARSTSDTCGQGRPSSRKPREKLGRRRAPCGGAPGSRILPGPCRVRRR